MPTPSLILVPARFKTGKLYTPVATTSGGLVLGASGDFNVTRATTATRVNANGNIEVVASGIPRLDYFASGGVVGCPALLVEPSAANGILNSQDTATNWLLGANLTSGYVDVIGVSGNNLTVAASGSGMAANAGALRRPSNNVALASGSTYTISFLMKKTGTHTIGAYYAVIGGLDLAAGFNVSGSFSSGQIFTNAFVTNRIRRVEQFGTDVYRCSETFTMTSGVTFSNLFIGPTVSTTANTNPAVGLGIAFAAPQIELGAIPTSFIPTTAAAVTRNADVVSVSGAVSGCIGQTEGTLYAELDFRNLGYNGAIVTLQTDNWITNSIQIQKSLGNQWRFTIRAASTVILNVDVGTITAGIYKIALGYNTATSGTVLAVNGSILSTQTASSIPACNSVVLGTRSETGTNFTIHLNDRIRAAALYTTRLTNAELAALTTL
jgi:hypothetical protein